MADINNFENWSGPFKSRADAIEDIRMKCGTGYEGLTWTIGTGRNQKWYANDGVDPDTGKPWKTRPKKGICAGFRA